MKRTEIEGDKLITILKETGLNKRSKNFADRLAHLVVHSYKRNYSAEPVSNSACFMCW